MSKRFFTITLIAALIIFSGGIIFFSGQTNTLNTTSTKIRIVAAENFYGNIASQLGGANVEVVSLLSDPNADPHEYESSVSDAKAVANANIVIENGDNYDTWMDKLLSSSPNNSRIVIIGANVATNKLVDNPHIWYSVDNIKAVAQSIDNALKHVDPSKAQTFASNLTAFDNSLSPITQKMAEIKAKYNQTPIGLTETIFLYQTGPMGLKVLTPLAFERAIAEGNDPSANDVATSNNQILKHEIKVLIYNEQTITPITTNLQNEARANNIPVVGVTETMTADSSYQSWMLNQLNNLQNALKSTK